MMLFHLLTSFTVWSHRFVTYLIIVALVFFSGLFQFKRLSPAYKVLVLLIGLGVVSDLASRFFAIRFGNSMPGYHIFIPLQYFLISLFYSAYLKKYGVWFSYSQLLVLLASIFNSIYYQSIWTIPSNIVLITGLLFIVYSFFAFKHLLMDISGKPLIGLDIFWCNVAILAYFTCTFFCWSFYNFFVRHNMNARFIADIIYVANYLYYLTLGFAIFLNSKRNRNVE